jgi:hypothetical protein
VSEPAVEWPWNRDDPDPDGGLCDPFPCADDPGDEPGDEDDELAGVLPGRRG